MAKANKIKNLNLTELKKEVKKLDSQREVTLFIGEEPYNFKVDEKFKKTKQHKVLDDMVEFFNESRKNIELLEVATPYTTLLIIKHFTNVEISDDINEALEFLDVLIDLEVLEKIVNELPEEELEKIYKLLASTVERMKENIADADKLDDELANREFENAVVKEVLVDGKEQ